MDDRYDGFPEGFFARADNSPDSQFYVEPRLVVHIDPGAITAVGELYDELGLHGDVLDICSSWVSHFTTAPERLVALGMNEAELANNPQAKDWVVRDLNTDPTLPFDDASFDAVTCCVSVDYLVRPLEVFDEAARVLRPGAPFVCTFSNRCFPTKAIRGWLASTDESHVALVARYFELSKGWGEVVAEQRATAFVDPLYAVWARRGDDGA
jgi:hypothetical protein